jgi:HTH-type transcriptional regulator/antitoxin HigA
MSALPSEFQSHWAVLRPILSIRNHAEYEQAVDHLNILLDEVGDDEGHPLYDLLDTLGTLIHVYEEEFEPMPPAGAVEVLRYLMEEHGLQQGDLPEVGSQGVVSEILSGKRELNVRQIRALARRFHISPAALI